MMVGAGGRDMAVVIEVVLAGGAGHGGDGCYMAVATEGVATEQHGSDRGSSISDSAVAVDVGV